MPCKLLKATTDSEEFFYLSDRKAILVFIIILLAALVFMMLSLIMRSIRETKAKEAEKARRKGKKRFSRLSESDKRKRKSRSAEINIGLAGLCDGFRNFAASRMGLYYDINVIRAFISSLSVTKLIIMQGISGTGKTSLGFALGKYFSHDAVIVPVQPSWKDRTDMLGYYNEFTGTFTETDLLCALYEAGDCDDICITVLDEMNIARVEYYFAEFLSVLELPDKSSRKIEVTSDSRQGDPERLKDGKLALSDNVWFIGTANNDDSTLAISDKVYDRAMIIELDSRSKPFESKYTEPVYISASRLEALFEEARKNGGLSSSCISAIEELDRYLIDNLGITFGNRIMRQISSFVPVFTACGGSESDAVDLILCKKVLRKLESQNPVFVRSKVAGLCSTLDTLFGEGRLPMCRAYVNRFTR